MVEHLKFLQQKGNALGKIVEQDKGICCAYVVLKFKQNDQFMPHSQVDI